MEKRFILFFFISAIIISVYPFFLTWFGGAKNGKKIEGPSSPTMAGGLSTPPQEALSHEASKDIVVETDLYRAILSSQGGVIKLWELKKYTSGPEQKMVAFSTPDGGIASFEILSKEAPMIGKGVYHVEGHDLLLSPENPDGRVQFVYRDPETGREVIKKFTFHYNSYHVDVEVKGAKGAILSLGTNFGISQQGGQGFPSASGPIALIDGSIVRENPSKIDQEKTRTGRTSWAALQDKYFLAALIPDGTAESAVFHKDEGGGVSAGVRVGSDVASFLLYAGPKEYDRLRALKANLEESIDFGWFIFGSWFVVRGIAKPLFHILRFLYHYTQNYGIAIILLTVLVKILFIPLTHKSFVSMREMQKIQPEVTALQKKYKNDREQLNKELMGLYKRHKVNPMSGCLPTLLQLPVFVALFNILYTTIDLRQAPFILWISDLSSQDPYYILPLFLGVTMILQQLMSANPNADPTQAKLFLILPVVYTFLFLSFPSGLVLYWLTNNCLTITQQYLSKKYSEQPA